MLRKSLPLVLLWYFVGIPAFAGQWLEFASGQSNPRMSWTGPSAPVPGVNASVGATIMPWVVVNGDVDPQHYTLQNGEVVFNPPSPPAAIGPNPTGFMTALRTEQTFNAAIRGALAQWYAIFQADIINPTALQQDWQDFITNYSSVITPTVQTTILNYAKTYSIPLTGN